MLREVVTPQVHSFQTVINEQTPFSEGKRVNLYLCGTPSDGVAKYRGPGDVMYDVTWDAKNNRYMVTYS